MATAIWPEPWQEYFEAAWAAKFADVKAQPERVTVEFAGEPLSVTKSQLDAIRRLGDPHKHD